MSVNGNEKDVLFYEVLKEICMNSKIIESEEYIQHGNTSVFMHSIAVAYYSHSIALIFKLPVDERKLIRGALLHDYFLYDWHKKDIKHPLHGIRHPYIALQNANRDLRLSNIEKDIILKHMFPLTLIPPRYLESVIVCIIDKACSVYETFYLNLIFNLYDIKLKKVALCKANQ
ncbi:MAG: HD domain-containing protein [Mobilitalea sp.]